MATVTPGIAWASGDTLNVTNMNLAANPVVTLATDEVTTAKILDANVTNAKIASGVDAAKLTTGTLPVARLAAGSVTLDKLESVTAGRVVLGNASNVPTGTAVSGDVTITSAGVTSIGNAKVTAAKMDGVAKDNAGSNLTVGTTPVFGCRAFVNFDGTKDTTGAVSELNTDRLIRAAGNISSVTRNSEGSYTITFSPALPDSNYAVVITTCGNAATDTSRGGVVRGAAASGANLKTTTQLAIVTGTTSTGAVKDLAEVNVIIIR